MGLGVQLVLTPGEVVQSKIRVVSGCFRGLLCWWYGSKFWKLFSMLISLYSPEVEAIHVRNDGDDACLCFGPSYEYEADAVGPALFVVLGSDPKALTPVLDISRSIPNQSQNFFFL